MSLGKKQMEQLSAFVPTLIAFGIGGFLNMVYFTDWKAVAMYIPYYNGALPPPKDKKEGCD